MKTLGYLSASFQDHQHFKLIFAILCYLKSTAVHELRAHCPKNNIWQGKMSGLSARYTVCERDARCLSLHPL